MADPSDIKYAEQLLMRNLMEWRDAGGSVESVTGSILRLIVAREAFATMVRAEVAAVSAPETCALCNGTKQTYPAGSFEPKPCPKCCSETPAVPCIWRAGCDKVANCQEAGCCLGLRSNRGEPG